MSVALRMALDRDPDAALGTIATAGTALVVALVAATAETPARGLHLSSAWPFLLAGLLSPGAAQIFVTAHRFAMAQDNEMPEVLGALHGKYATPHMGVWVLVGVSAVIGAIMALTGFFGLRVVQ